MKSDQKSDGVPNQEELARRIREIGANHLRQAENMFALAEEIEGESPTMPASAEKLLEKRVCLQCDDGIARPPGSYHRGLCTAHYHQTLRKMERHEANEAQLIRHGLLAPKRKGGPRSVDTSALDDFLKSQDAGKPKRVSKRKPKKQ